MLPRRPPWRRVAAQTAGALAVAAVATTLTWVATRPAEPVPPRVSRLRLAPSGTAALTISGNDRDLAITPDGSRVIYVGNRGTQLFVHALDALEPVAVFTGMPRGLFVSPDSQWIGFQDGPAVLKKVAVTGGPAVTLATLDGGPRGATWGPEDTIIVATNNATTGLQRVAAAGGSPTVLTRPDRAQGELDHLWPELLPGGRAVLFTITALTGGLDAAQVAVPWDLGRTTLTRVTFDPGIDTFPVWTPDGRRLIFASDRAGARNVFRQAADVTSAVEQLTDSPNMKLAAAVSPDGARLIFTATAQKTGEDVMQVDLDGTHRVTPLVQSPFAERNGVVSPDGRWLAYEANDSGQFEIYVRPFPAVNSGHWLVSTGGGNRPLWARNGQELFFLSPTGELMRVGIERSATWAATTPTKVLGPGHYYYGAGGYVGPTYDVSPDGQRFLRIKEGGGTDQTAAPPQVIVVQHWVEELKRLVPTK